MKVLLSSLCVVATILSVCESQGPLSLIQPVAMATINPATSQGATGYVKVYGGKIVIQLDLTNFNFSATQKNRTECRAGINYHIHGAIAGTMVGDACTAAGGHYDPWYACGGATGASACANKGGCISRNYSCSKANWEANPLTGCEVGDWSGKYGSLMPVNSSTDVYMFDSSTVVDPTTNPVSRFEISSAQLYSTMKSVVFHCGSPRILCAPFAPNAMQNLSISAPPQGLAAATTAGTRTVADFGASGGPLIELGGGEVKVGGDGVKTGMAGIMSACSSQTPSTILMAIMDGTLASGPATNTACAGAVLTGGVYDPTVSCVPGSSASSNGGNCQGASVAAAGNLLSYRCNATFGGGWFNYSAQNFMADPYLAAQGALLPYNPTKFNMTSPYPFMDQAPSRLTGKIFLISCGNPLTGPKWCTPIAAGLANYTAQTPPPTTVAPNTTTTPAPAPTSGAAARCLFGIAAMVVGLVAAQ